MKVYGIMTELRGQTCSRPELYTDQAYAREVLQQLKHTSVYDGVELMEFCLPTKDPVAPKSDRERLVALLTEIGIPYKDHDDDCLDIGTKAMIDGLSYAQVVFNEDGSYHRLV